MAGGISSEATAALTRVLLVDGVGNAVVYDRQRDQSTICLKRSRTIFVRTLELVDGLAVYRLRACGVPVIRHINRYVGEPSDGGD